MSVKSILRSLANVADTVMQRAQRLYVRFVIRPALLDRRVRLEVIRSSKSRKPMTPSDDPFAETQSREERALMQTQKVPMNRHQRRAIAKRAGVRFSVVNRGMQKTTPTYLGIREFKHSAKRKKTGQTYKEYAWRSKHALDESRALKNAKVTDGKEIGDAALALVKEMGKDATDTTATTNDRPDGAANA